MWTALARCCAARARRPLRGSTSVSLRRKGQLATTSSSRSKLILAGAGSGLEAGEDEDRDEPVGLGLIFGVGRPGFEGPGPPDRALVAGDFPGQIVRPVGAVLQLHLRIGDQ